MIPAHKRAIEINMADSLDEEPGTAGERIKKLRRKRRRRKYVRAAGGLLIFIGIAMVGALLLTNTYTSGKQKELETVWRQSRAEILADMQADKESKGLGVKAAVAKAEVVEPTTQGAGPTTPNVTATTLDSQTELEQRYYQELQEKKAFGKMVVPKIDLDKIVVEGTSQASLRQGPGHMKKTPAPGELGNVVISGHRVTYGAPFYKVNELTQGDRIFLYSPTDKYEYVVVNKKIVSPKDVSVIKPTDDATLTLTTCHPPHSARYRLIIRAKLVPARYLIGGPR